MVAFKGTTAGSLKQYIQNKPDKFGFKLFCRASSDRFIHDILMYQGATTFSSHHTQLAPNEVNHNFSSKTVISLIKTMDQTKSKIIYADNFFSSITLVKYLLTNYNARYTGTARENRTGNPNIMATKEMSKKNTLKEQ